MAVGGGHFDSIETSDQSVLAAEFDNEDEIIGYVEPWIASPGEDVAVKVSSTVPKYTWSLVRLIQGLDHPKAPEVREELILQPDQVIDGSYKRAHSGSYAVVESWKSLPRDGIRGIRFSCFVEPWLPQADHEQVLISTLDIETSSGVALLLSRLGALCVYMGTGDSIAKIDTNITLRCRRWAAVDMQITDDQVVVRVKHCERMTEAAPEPSVFSACTNGPVFLQGNKPLTMAAGFITDGLSNKPTSFFNGRLDSPHIQLPSHGTSFSTWARYDFSVDIPTDNITDISGKAHHGVLVNAPTRAVKAHDWDGSEADWAKAKYGYGAIHFHEDDLDDAAWPTDFTVRIPGGVPSGAYAVVVRPVDREKQHIVDSITFFVRPPSHPTTAPKPRVAMVLSTFTYLAYANERMFDQTRASRMTLSGGVSIRKDSNWRRMARRDDLGCSLYDVHRDGSGSVFSTARRPIINMRPSYVNWAFHRPREFSADQLMISFLEQRLGRGAYDVLTDHDLHLRGAAALEGYDVVITGCHPEYPSLEILDAYAGFVRRGGHIMYLGGNGFYWCAAMDHARPHRLEVRKGDQGCRSVELPAGERNHSLNGAQGGLWRARGRTPQSLFGIGSCACGSGPGVPYRFSDKVVQSAEFSWLLDNLEKDEAGNVTLLGTEGFGGGASGDEIDRLDFSLGSPSNTVLLATSTGHDDSFGVFNEEVMFPMVDTVGTKCGKVRSDMTIYETSGGGSVFSVGSINWYSSLGWNACDNDVARLTWNVLIEFLRRAESKRTKQATPSSPNGASSFII